MKTWKTREKVAKGCISMIGVINWLQKDRWFTQDLEFAKKSLWQWEINKENLYSTSILGVINGILPIFGIVLVIVRDHGTQKPLRLKLKRKWWK